LESDDDRGASSTIRLNIEKDALLNFELVKRFKNRIYMSEFGVLETARAEEFRMS